MANYYTRVVTHIVVAAVIIEAGKVLLSRRKAGTHLAGKWEFPGGKVEEGEDPRDALRRELIEELGIETRIGEIVDVTFHRYVADPPKSGGDGKAVLLLFFDAERLAGEPRAIDVAEVGWFAADALDPALFPPADVAILAKVRARLA
jgi:8-oxo-dGTP diphosphatase